MQQPVPGGESGGRARWRLLTITTFVTAVVTAVVTLAFSGVGPLWRAVFPESPVTVHVDRHRPPLVTPSVPLASRPAATQRDITARSGPQYAWSPQAWALPAHVDPAGAPRVSAPVDDDAAALDFISWVTRSGGADVGTTRLRITVTGQNKDVVIDGLCARVVGPRSAPLNGVLLYLPPDGDPPEPASLDLDSGRPCAPELSAAPLHVEAHKNKVIEIIARTRANTVTWYPELQVVADGKRVAIPIGETQPYRTTALLDELTGYGRYLIYTRSDSAAPSFRESLPDPSEIEEIRSITYGEYE
ncbi:hypothetical protein ACQP2E_12625 [Actinoplanes sp. CA-015351]|uniref:hypothetical protein n=1 Tax=Actinoplanes sp. CA-015351 TaxID=3239897 RepID=UPI003D978E34